MSSIIIFITTLLLVILTNHLLKDNLKKNNICKVLAIIYFSLYFISLILPDGFIKSVGDDIFQLKELNKFHAILRDFEAILPIVFIIATFYENKFFKNIAVYGAIIITTISIFSYRTYLLYYTDSTGRGINMIYWLAQPIKDFALNKYFRLILLIIKWFVSYFISFKILINDKYYLKRINLKDFLYTILILLLLLIQMAPIYIFQILFGYSNIKFKPFSIMHICWIIYVIIKIITLYLIFKNKNYENKYILCLVLALSLIIQYNSMFSLTINIKRLPLQLCNLASYFILISLLSKNKHLFNFTFLINFLGASLALFFPDVKNNGLFEVWNMHFIYEHTNVICIPILCLSLNIFSSLNKRSLFDAFIGFSIYFIICLFLNTFLNAIAIKTNNSYFEVNYLFMYSKKVIIDSLPFLSFLTIIEIGNELYKMMPLVIIFIYFGYSLLYVLLYFLIKIPNLCHKSSKK